MLDTNYTLPPEWSPQEAVWLSWPSNPNLWPGRYEAIEPFFARYAAAISRFEPVRINICAEKLAAAAKQVEEAGANMERVRFFGHPNDDVWCRDHGPLFVLHNETGEVLVSDWTFNAWGEKFSPYENDDMIPRRIADSLGLKRMAHSEVLEGGAIEVNGEGQLLTTESVLCNPNRKWPHNKSYIERMLKEGLGMREVLWLKGGLDGDDTDGHIDNIARFVSDDTIVAAVAPAGHPSHASLAENWETLKSFRTARGEPFRLVELPLPDGDVLAPDGRKLPASYANFLIVNGGVLAPVFDMPSDARALGILKDLFPSREIVPLDCRDVLIEGGALHCLSMQQPAARPVG